MKNAVLSLMLLITIAFSQNAISQCTQIPFKNYMSFTTLNGNLSFCTKVGAFIDEEIQLHVDSMLGFPMKFDVMIDTIFAAPGVMVTSESYGIRIKQKERACFRVFGTPTQTGVFYFRASDVKFLQPAGGTQVISVPEILLQENLTPNPNCNDSFNCNINLRINDSSDFCGSINGKVFWDMNANCIYDSTDYPISNVPIKNQGNIYTFSKPDGNYTLYPTTDGDHTLNAITSYNSICNPGNVVSVTMDSTAYNLNGINFPIEPDPNHRDLSVNFNPTGWWLFGFTGTGHITYRNNSFYPADAIIKMRYDSLTKYVSSSVTPFYIDSTNRLIEWHINGIPPLSQGSILVQFQLPLPTAPSIPLNDTVWIFPITGDYNPRDNIFIADNLVTGAYDPNDKQVSPPGVDGKIGLADSLLSYKVRFQNTGTGPAVNVIIKDTLDSDLNLSSFRPSLASHPYTASLNGNIATFTFSNIMLPDSNANEPESHGFVQFNIKKKSGLGYGTVIENSASIYFDFNEPIKTNTVASTYFNFVSSVKDLETVSTVSLYPNPAAQKVTVVATEQMNELIFTDVSGAILKRIVPASVSIEIDLSELPAGIYFIAAKTAKATLQNRLIKY